MEIERRVNEISGIRLTHLAHGEETDFDQTEGVCGPYLMQVVDVMIYENA